MKYISKEALILALKAEKADAFEAVYQEAYKLVEYYIKSHGGQQEDAKDIFQEGIIGLLRLIRKPDFDLSAKLSSLMYSICRNLWLKSLRTKGKELPVEEFHRDIEPITLPETLEEETGNEKYKAITTALSTIGEKCKEIILLAHYQGVPRDEIAEQMGYTSAFTRIKLFRCMNKLRTMLGMDI